MAELKVGDKIKDNDPRISWNRVLRVERIEAQFAYCSNTHGPNVRINVARIHSDGKPRRTGFSVVQP